VHGDCDALVAVLKAARLIDDQSNWNGGKAHLVQVGDVPTRGPQTRKAMDLLMKLEPQAVAAGGCVHALIGNHEAMIMYGDYRSVLPEEFAEFKGPESNETLKTAFEQELAQRRRTGDYPHNPKETEEFRKKWLEYHVPGFVEFQQAFAPNAKYGKWIRSHNVIVRINDTLYLHGGIGPEFVSLSTAEINRKIQSELADPSKLPPGMTTNVEGPLWYRGLAEGDVRQIGPHLNTVLKAFGVKRVVVGHTVTRSAIMPRFGSRVVNIDIGLSRFYGRPPACLVTENGSSFVLHNGSKIPLPGPSKQELIEYLERVAQADSEPDRIRKAMDVVKSADARTTPRGQVAF
jgi:hypothetical protein